MSNHFPRRLMLWLAAMAAMAVLAGCTALIPKFVPSAKPEPGISAEFPFEGHDVTVMGSKMHYVDVGSGPTLVLLHGNPTSSYLWRNVIPDLAKHYRVIALDHIGMGKSDKPAIAYRLDDFIRYFDGFMEAMQLSDVTLVVHDWGGAIGIDWAMRHPAQVHGIAMMETIIAPMSWSQVDPFTAYLFRQFRDPVAGDELNIKDNYFIEQLLPAMSGRPLSQAEMDAYRAPFLHEADRKLIAIFPREIPFDGDPPDVSQRVAVNYEKLRAGTMPLLLLTARPGAIVQGKYLERLRTELPRMKVVDIGEGVHFIQESQPRHIAQAILEWRAAN